MVDARFNSGGHCFACTYNAQKRGPLVGTPTPGIEMVASGSYVVTMRTVGLKVLKNKLSECVRLVATGETVLVTDRDRVVAELRPPQGRGPLTSDALLAEAMRRGWLSAPLMVHEGPPSRAPVASFTGLMRELQSDRDER